MNNVDFGVNNFFTFSDSIESNFLDGPGSHTKYSPVVGSRVEELKSVKNSLEFKTILAKLEIAIYKNESHLIYIIPLDKKKLADEFSRKIFIDYIDKYKKYGLKEDNIVEWNYCNLDMPTWANKTFIIDNKWNGWRIKAIIEAPHGNYNEKNNSYLPPHIVAFHELMHVEETPKNMDVCFEKEEGNELLTTIKTFILLDTVYKKIHNIEIDSEVDYGKNIEVDGNSISLGAFTNFYRKCEQNYSSLASALISEESIAFLKTFIKEGLSNQIPAQSSHFRSGMFENFEFRKYAPVKYAPEVILQESHDFDHSFSKPPFKFAQKYREFAFDDSKVITQEKSERESSFYDSFGEEVD